MSRPASGRVHVVDVLRLLALAQMVNGHTLHAVLDERLRQGAVYAGYLWFRGLVSVAFMLVAGMAFYLTSVSRWEQHKRDPAARRRRVLRAFEIIAIGLVLRFPLPALLRLDLRGVVHGLSGLAHIDVLPCIGVSLLVMEGLTRVCRKPAQVLIACALLVCGAALLTPWGATLPTQGAIGFVTGWLGPQAGSAFPLLPFSGYVFAGLVLGAIALPQGGNTASAHVSGRLLLMAAGLAMASLIASRAPWSVSPQHLPNVHTPSFFLEKLAVVSLALAVLSVCLRRVSALPNVLRILSGETLAIYVFHLCVLYGPFALARRIGSHLPLAAALGVSACMLLASIAVGLAWHAFKQAPRTQAYVPSSRTVVATAAALLATSALVWASRGLAAPAHATGSSVRSIALTVDDLDSARRFFVDTLGFRATSAEPRALAGPELAGLFGLPGAQARSQRLQLGQETIELLAFAQPTGRPAPADSHSDDLWFQHLALVTSDIDAVQTRLAASRAAAISAAVQTIPRANPAAAGIRAFYFRGPAAHPLELIWFPLGKGMSRWQSKQAPLLGIDHTAIAVSDTERSRRFYSDLLGLKVAGHSFNEGREQVALSGVPGARVRITGLRGAEGPGVEFLHYVAPQRGRIAPQDAHPNDLWHWETTIAVDNLDHTVAQLRAAAVRFVSDGVHDTRQFGDSTRGVVVLDPDGHAVRVVQ